MSISVQRAVPAVLLALLAGAGPASSGQVLPEPVENALLSALEDEYHAEAFYAAVIDAFGPVRPFTNIIGAEQTHSSALASLMLSYGMAVPANTQIGATGIVDSVPASLSEACAAGAEAEIANMALYNDALLPAVSAYPDIVSVMQSLSAASQQRHLPAFERCAVR